MSKPKKLVFFGNERLATGVTTVAPTIQALIDSGHHVVAVVSSYSQGVSRSNRTLEIAEVAKSHSIPLLLPERPLEIIGQLKDYQADVGVLVAYGKILPQDIIDIFPNGIINIHPSLLPAYRGPTPVETAILDGAKTTGVSLMKLTSKMDSGAVFAQEIVKLDGRESKQKLADRLLGIGSQLLMKNLESILDGAVSPKPQNESKATYTQMIRKPDGEINWEAKTAERIEREVRAYLSFPKSRARVWDKYEVVITKSRVAADKDDGRLVIETKDGYLEVLELVAPSGKLVSGSNFKLGYKS